MDAQIHRRFITGMYITANEAEFCSDYPRFDAASRHDASRDPVLTALKIDDVSWPELRQAQKPWSVDGMRFRGCRNERPDRQARKIVTRDEALIGKISVGVKIGFGPV